MKAFIYTLLVIVIICVLNFFWYLKKEDDIFSSYRFEYHVINNDTLVTVLKNHGKSYIIKGIYNKKEIPNSYIRPLYSGLFGSYDCCIGQKGDSCIIYYLGSNAAWEVESKDPKFKIQYLSDNRKYNEMLMNKKDSIICIYGGGE